MFYTKKGDLGKSPAFGKSVSKKSLELDVLGNLDELNSLLGIVKNEASHFKKIISDIQNDLFIIQAIVAEKSYKQEFKLKPFEISKVTKLETLISDLARKIKPQKTFVIYGENKSSAWLDYARAVTRRVERKAWKLNTKIKLPQECLNYLNRLSSLLYAMARSEAHKTSPSENTPTYN